MRVVTPFEPPSQRQGVPNLAGAWSSPIMCWTFHKAELKGGSRCIVQQARLGETYKMEETDMPKRDKTGPPKKATGPKDGRGGGKGRHLGSGAGKRTGGKKGPCKKK